MPNITVLLSLMAVVFMSLNLFVFFGLNYRRLIDFVTRWKRKKQIDKMLNHAVNKLEIRNMINRNNGVE